ncbi:MAG: hypothetical protein CVU39_10180 [Chloroflexi bacterium HGW-Chloroflexi-10]|nr:MAG: hypothetical protein CVU39_10180 [Chloroflexi bacterium HGW-Chloroflexi-10]
MGAIFDNKSKAVINYTLSFDASARGASVEHIYNFFTFSTQDQDVIDLIDVEGMGGEIPVEFPRLWEGYSPERIISDYEKPSRIFLSSTPYDVRNTGYVGYFLWLFYDNQGFMIRYDGVIKFTPTYHICPRIQHEGEITNIHLVSVGPGSTLALETQDEIFGSDYHKVIALEEATGITIDMFTQLFKHNQISSCFESPLDVWK